MGLKRQPRMTRDMQTSFEITLDNNSADKMCTNVSHMNGWFSQSLVATWVTLSVQARNIYAMKCNSSFFKRIPSGNQSVAMENHPFIVDFSNKNLHLLVVFQLTMLDYQRVQKILQTLGTDGIAFLCPVARSVSAFQVPKRQSAVSTKHLDMQDDSDDMQNHGDQIRGSAEQSGFSSTWASNLPMDTCYLYMAPKFWPHLQYHLLQTYASWTQHQHNATPGPSETSLLQKPLRW